MWLVLALHALVLLALLLSRPPLAVHVVAVLAWAASLLWAVRDHRQWPANGVTGLALHASGWQLLQHGRLQPADLLPGAFVTVPVMVLRFRRRDTGKTLRVVVWADSGTADGIRRLRVRVLQGELPGGEGSVL